MKYLLILVVCDYVNPVQVERCGVSTHLFSERPTCEMFEKNLSFAFSGNSVPYDIGCFGVKAE